MANYISDVGVKSKREIDNGGDVHSVVYHNFNNNILPLPKKMAQIKLAWILFHALGAPCLLLSMMPDKYLKLIDINIGEIEQPYKTGLWILASIYMVTLIARSFEKWHRSHLLNKEHRLRLKNYEHAGKVQH